MAINTVNTFMIQSLATPKDKFKDLAKTIAEILFNKFQQQVDNRLILFRGPSMSINGLTLR
jgi:hypothetical protein